MSPELGLRHQTDVEMKWGIHRDGETRTQPWANGDATTISVLIHDCLRVTFHTGGTPQVVSLENEGDYLIFGPDTVRSWEAIGHTVILSVRFGPSTCSRKPGLQVARAVAELDLAGAAAGRWGFVASASVGRLQSPRRRG